MSLNLSVRYRRAVAPMALGLAMSALLGSVAVAEEGLATLTNSKPGSVTPGARLLGPVGRSQHVQFAVTLPLRDAQGLEEAINDIYDKTNPSFHKFLTPEQITQSYGPTQEDYSRLATYFRGMGLNITGTHSNRLVLDVEGPVGAAEAALHVHFNSYAHKAGDTFFMADRAPSLPTSLAASVNSVVGLDNSSKLQPQFVRSSPNPGTGVRPMYGTGHGGYLAPANINEIYGIKYCFSPNGGVQPTGVGTKVALVEFDTTKSTALATYCKYYGLHTPTQTWVNVDGGPGAPGGGEVEVALDLDMVAAVAPYSSIYIYQAPNSWTSVVDTYNQIATDNKVSAVSTSWGSWETSIPKSVPPAEYPIFQEMAAEGISMFSASGDYGAIDPNTYNAGTYKLSVLDPAAQPYVTGVGGTTLSNFSSWAPGNGYPGETGWGLYGVYGSGGGISANWGIPGYQASTIYLYGYNGASLYYRNVPDVALNADPGTGYDVYSALSGWIGVGGTSAASPLWAGYTALVNQGRATLKLGNIGYMNPAVYGIYTTSLTGYTFSHYDFEDITTGTNAITADGGYNCGAGYDNVTGLGSFVANELFYEMLMPPTQVGVPLPPATVKATANAVGSHSITVTWSKSLGAKTYLIDRSGSIIAATAGTSYTATGLTAGTTYTFFIVAGNAAGASGYSAGASAKAQ